MSKRKPNRMMTRWAWGALATAAPIFAQDPGGDANRRVPPPVPMPPASAPSKIIQTPTKAPQTPPRSPPPAAPQPPAGGSPSDPTTAPDVRKIIDAHATNPNQKAADQREALLLYQQAVAAHQANRSADALRFGRRAKQLFPTNQEISNFVAQVQRESGAGKAAAPSVTKAKAYLAAGYTRGVELLRAGRIAQGEDLLSGVVQASKLFPDPSQVDFFRKLAEGELEQSKLAHQNAPPPPVNDQQPNDPNGTVPPPTPEPPRPGVGLAPADNVRRLARLPEARVPSWYVQQKNKLSRSMSVDYRNASAAEVLDAISAKAGVEFVIDRPVAMARSHINTLVDFRAGDVPAEFVLDLVCQKAGFEYVLMERSVVITTRSKALEYLRLLPEALRSNWLVARTLFPETSLDLIAAAPGPTPTPPTQTPPTVRPRSIDEDVPAYLQSGAALVAAIQVLVK
jgi:hypothetical protein